MYPFTHYCSHWTNLCILAKNGTIIHPLPMWCICCNLLNPSMGGWAAVFKWVCWSIISASYIRVQYTSISIHAVLFYWVDVCMLDRLSQYVVICWICEWLGGLLYSIGCVGLLFGLRRFANTIHVDPSMQSCFTESMCACWLDRSQLSTHFHCGACALLSTHFHCGAYALIHWIWMGGWVGSTEHVYAWKTWK